MWFVLQCVNTISTGPVPSAAKTRGTSEGAGKQLERQKLALTSWIEIVVPEAMARRGPVTIARTRPDTAATAGGGGGVNETGEWRPRRRQKSCARGDQICRVALIAEGGEAILSAGRESPEELIREQQEEWPSGLVKYSTFLSWGLLFSGQVANKYRRDERSRYTTVQVGSWMDGLSRSDLAIY